MNATAGQSSKLVKRLVWVLLAIAVALGIASTTLFLLNPGTPIPPRFGVRGLGGSGAIVFALVGTILATRRPGNPIGWTLLLLGVDIGVQGLVDEYAIYSLYFHPGSLPGGIYAVWVYSWIYYPQPGALPLLLLWFPDGRMPSPSRWWRAAVWTAVGWSVIGMVFQMFVAGPIPDHPRFENPFGYLPNEVYIGVLGPLTVIAVASMLAAIWGTVLRYRRGSKLLRQQVKWFALAASLAVLMLAANAVNWAFDTTLQDPAVARMNKITSVGFEAFVGLMPVAIGIAIMRYRLYDIDVFFRRTLVYGPLTAVLAGVFAATISVTQKVFVAVTGQRSDAAVVFTTLVVVAMTTPARTFIQGAVDRRFKNLHDPQKELQSFTQQVVAVSQVMDRRQLLRRFLDEAATAFEAEGGMVSVAANQAGAPAAAVETLGWKGAGAVTAMLSCDGREIGSVTLGHRRDGREYSARDRATLQTAAEAVARAYVLAGGATAPSP